MTTSEIKKRYALLNKEIKFVHGNAFRGATTFADNMKAPIHRWYYYKEGYSHKIIGKLLKRYPLPDNNRRILDPFCGAGTTLLAAQQLGIDAVGVDINPFSVLLSRAKINWHKVDLHLLNIYARQVCTNITCRGVELPLLTTLHNNDYFPDRHAYKLVAIRQRIESVVDDNYIKDLLLLALAKSIESSCYLHKDGRMLKVYQHRHVLEDPVDAFMKCVAEMVHDIKATSRLNLSNIDLHSTDGIQLKDLKDSAGKFGAVIYSPPYANGFDYSEVYKLDLWVLGLITIGASADVVFRG